MRLRHVFFWALLLVAPHRAAGQQVDTAPADSVYSMEEITVTAIRSEASHAVVSQRVTVIGRDEVDSAGAQSLSDLLSRRSALFVRQYGQGLATLSSRGSTPSQSLLLIDGMRLSDPQLGQFDLSLLPAYLIGTLEVLHGPASALYGSDGISGAVNIRPLRAEADHISIGATAGAFGERMISGAAALGGDGWSAVAAGEVSRTNGDFAYIDEALFPPRAVRRLNADREKHSLFASAEGRKGRHHLQGSLLYIDAEQGLPGLASSRPAGERQWDDHLRFWVDDGIVIPSGEVHVRGHVHRSAIRYVNPPLDLDAVGRALTSGMEVEGRFELGSRTTMIGGVSGGHAAAEHPSLSSRAREYSFATFVSGAGRVGPLRLYPAMRLDLYRPYRGEARRALNPGLGANLRPFPGLPLHLKAHAGRAFRMPTFNDRFWQPGGNPELKPERSWSYEAGIFYGAAVEVEATAFASRTVDQLTWTPRAGGFWAPENLSRSRTNGVEISVRKAQRLGRSLIEAGSLYMWTRALDRSDPSSPAYGKQLRYVPRHGLKTYLSLQSASFTLGLHTRYVGRRYVTNDETEWVQAAFAVDARLTFSRRLGPFMARLSLDVENLGDARYEIINNYPMPPRHARVGLLIRTASGTTR